MEKDCFRVDPKMLVPVILSMITGVILIFLEGATPKGLLLLIVLCPFFYLGAEILARKITFTDDGVLINKFLRSVSLNWAEIKSVDAVQSGSKLFLILIHDKGRPVLITNTIQRFASVAKRIMDNVPPNKVDENAGRLLENPPSKLSPLIQAWLVFLILGGLVAGRFVGF
jgi:hypothetical protein